MHDRLRSDSDLYSIEDKPCQGSHAEELRQVSGEASSSLANGRIDLGMNKWWAGAPLAS